MADRRRNNLQWRLKRKEESEEFIVQEGKARSAGGEMLKGDLYDVKIEKIHWMWPVKGHW